MHRDPGLDLTQLAAYRRPHPNTNGLPDRIRAHLSAHDGYLAFSSGKDSLVVLHLTLGVEPNVPVVFFDSGLEYPETYQYLRQLRIDLDLQLHWMRPARSALEVLVDSGAWDHDAPTNPDPGDLHTILISEPAARAHAEHGPGELWGVRAEESHGRATLYAAALRRETTQACRGCCASAMDQLRARREAHGGIIRRLDGTVAYGPLWNWRTTDVWSYLARHRLPVNPVYAKLQRLGAPPHASRISHMLDGNHLEHGRATWIRRGWPALFEDLTRALPRLREFV